MRKFGHSQYKAAARLTICERYMLTGIRPILLDASWLKLTLFVIVLYLVAGAVVGAVVYMCASIFGSTDALEDEDTENAFFFWWSCGLWLLLMDRQYQPKSPIEYIVSFLAPVMGSMLTLMLFGVVYEKFAQRQSTIVFARMITLRRGGEEHGGHVVLTFRYANTRGLFLVGANVSAIALVREQLGDGDTVIVQRDVPIWRQFIVVPPAAFVHHVISPESPFYDPKSPTSCSFVNVIAIGIAVSGTDCMNQDEHAAYQLIDLQYVECDMKFKEMLRYKGENIGSQHNRIIDFEAFHALEESHVSSQLRVLRPGMSYASIGLPHRDDEKTVHEEGFLSSNGVAELSGKEDICNLDELRRISL